MAYLTTGFCFLDRWYLPSHFKLQGETYLLQPLLSKNSSK